MKDSVVACIAGGCFILGMLVGYVLAWRDVNHMFESERAKRGKRE